MSPDAWTLSTHEFRTLWKEFDADDYPTNEFAYTGHDDVGRGPDAPQLPTVRVDDLTDPQRAALTALCRPSITVALSGTDASKPFTDPNNHLRLVSATDDNNHVYIARQRLGSSLSVGGTVSITRHSFASWTRDLVAMIPPAEAVGGLPADTAVVFEAIPGVDTGKILTVVAPRSRTAASAFTHPQPGFCGSIRVSVGSITDGRRPTSMEVRYRDIPDDGRYLLIVDSPGAALPVDATTFAKTLNRVINTIRARHATRSGAAR